MIIEYLVDRVLAVGSLMLGVLPVDPTSAVDVSGMVHLYSWMNTFLPVAESIELLVLTVEVLVVIGGMFVVIWLLRRLPFGLGGS